MVFAASVGTDFFRALLQGMPAGAVYALVALGFVLTYKTSGVFNLAFAAQAYVSAAIFYAAVSQHHWSKWAGFVLAVVVAGPALGYLLDRFLFRHMRTAPTVVKLISGLGLLIGVPSIVQFFWPGQHQNPPSLSPKPNAVYHFGSYHIDGNQLVDLILQHYDSLDPKYKGILPLRRVFIPEQPDEA